MMILYILELQEIDFILWGIRMSVNYNKLWKLMIDKNMNKTQSKKAAHLSTNVIAKLGKNEKVSIEH